MKNVERLGVNLCSVQERQFPVTITTIITLMKRLLTNLLLFSLISGHFTSFSQIVFENSYNHSGTYTHLSVSGDKFFLMDAGLNQCRIYNTDHTLWKTINLNVPSGNYLYDIKFVSENLFTTNNTLCLAYIYYYYDAVNQYYTYNTKIIKENGSELLTIPGCQYLSIYNTSSSGTKLLTYSYDYSLTLYAVITRVYNLPGTLTSIDEPVPEFSTQFLQPAFPNPASTEVIIPLPLSAGHAPAILRLSSQAGLVVREAVLMPGSRTCTLNVQSLPSGVYLYSIDSSTGLHTGKIVIN